MNFLVGKQETRRPKPMQLRSIATFGLLVSAIAFAHAASAQDKAPKVSVAAAITEEIVEQVSFIGKGEAVDSVELIARVGGFLREVNVADGSAVLEGDVLFHIEPDAYQATLAAREADLARSNANLNLAEIELDRKRQLVARDTVAQSELDIAQANADVATAEVRAAEAAKAQSELDLSYTQIHAPFQGRIGRVQRSVGALVDSSTGPLATLVRESPVYVSFSLSERQLADYLQSALTNGQDPQSSASKQSVYVELANGTPLDEVGRIVFADNQIDPSTGTITIRAEFPNADGLIVDGGFVNVRIEAPEAVARLTIPQAAVQRDQRGDFVLAVNSEQIVEQRYVTLGDQAGISIIVQSGLQEGETVIIEGLQRVRPGVPVQAVLAGTGE